MWLDDLIINAAQNLLKVQFPHVGGFQDTILQKNLSFKIENGEFVQVLNKGGNHWITVTTIGVNNMSSVRVFDSLESSKFDFEMQSIIGSLVHTKSQEIIVKVEDVQHQEDSSSCGLFAIAYAVSLCFTDDPRQIQFDKNVLRAHLLQCLVQRKMSRFPQLSGSRKLGLGNLASISVHCTCRLPLDPDDLSIVEKCSLCNDHYHRECEANKKRLVISRNGAKMWICSKCSDQCNLHATYEIIDHNSFQSTVTVPNGAH